MNSQTTPNTNTSAPIQPNPGRPFIKWLIVFVLILIFIPVGAVIVQKYVLPQKPPATPPIPTLTGLEIAKKTAQFIDTTIKEDGSFQLYYRCNATPQPICTPKEQEGPQHSGYIILFYNDLFEKTKEPSYKTKADKAMELFLGKCAQSSDYCQSNFFPLFAYYKTTGDKRYLDGMLRVSDTFLEDKPLTDYVGTNAGIKLANLYEATEEKKYLDKLTKIADEILAGKLDSDQSNQIIYYEEQVPIRFWLFHSIWSVYLPAYTSTKNPLYLQAAQDAFAKANIPAHYDYFKPQARSSFELVFAIESLTSLAQLTGQETYKSQAKILAQKLLIDLWDSPENKKYTGDYGFLSQFSSDKDSKETLNTAWIARLFLKMDEEEFILK